VAVKIKLKRLGKIRAPYYRIIVADARTKRDGRAIEEIGKYHPKAEPSFIEVDSERAQHWLSVGAQPTDPVRKILEITGDWQKFKGLPGTEGTLRVAAPKESRKDIFAAAVKETLGDAAPAKGKGRSASKDSDDKSEKSGKASGKDASAKGDKPARAKASDAKASGAKASDAKASDAKASDAKASDAKASDAKASDAKVSDAKASEASGKAKSGEAAKSGDAAEDAGAKDKPKATKGAKGGAADAQADASADAASEPSAQTADSESASGD
jgi:small subunit ribosomal protein S16